MENQFKKEDYVTENANFIPDWMPDNAKPVYTDKDIMEMLHIDRKTLKKYRDEGLIGYTHPHDKYFYSHQDLMDFMANENIRYDAFNIK